MKPFFLPIRANARRLPLADKSVHCWVTSPPYWGLRCYGTSPQVWGGDDDCAHEWGGERVIRETRGIEGCTLDSPGEGVNVRFDKNLGAFCRKCGAWRGEYGSEPTPDLYVAHTVEIFREVRRVLRDDGTLWLNLGDCYATVAGAAKNPGSQVKIRSALQGKHTKHMTLAEYPSCQPNRMPIEGLKPKDQVFIPHRVAIALQADGWYCRDTIIWHKPNPMPSSVTDRTTTAHEYLFLLTKSRTYFYDADAIREPITSTGGASFGGVKKGPILNSQGKRTVGRRVEDPAERNHPLGRNKRSVWTISTQSFHGAHFATFPTKLVEPCIKAGTSEKGCCPHCGAPWRRVVERIDSGLRQKAADGWDTGDGAHGSVHRAGREKDKGDQPVMARVTTHWLPSCKCPAHEPIPCVVGDNFSGAFTTAVVAKRLGRSFVGTELNAEYIAMGVKRVEEDRPKPAKRKRAAGAQKAAVIAHAQLDLYAAEVES